MKKRLSLVAGVWIVGFASLAGCGTEGIEETTTPMASPAQSVWGFETTYGGGFNRKGSPIEGKGKVTVDNKTDEICYEQQILGASSAHLHREDRETLVTFFEPPQEFRPTMCVSGVADDALEEIVSDPESFYIEFHNRNSGGALSSMLREVDS